MDKKNALQFAEKTLSEMQSKSYGELVEMIGNNYSKLHELNSVDYYQIEIQVLWDDPKEKKDIRVICGIDGSGVSAHNPISTDFIITP